MPRLVMVISAIMMLSALGCQQSPDGDSSAVALTAIDADDELRIETAIPSPLGTKIVFQSARDGYGVYTVHEAGSNVQRLRGGWDPDWSPDGLKIAYADANPHDIFVMDGDGNNIERLTNSPDRDVYPEWSPDGSQIAFSRRHDDHWQVWVVNADGSNERNLTNSITQDSYPVWSPDGTTIAFQRGMFEAAEIYLMDADGSNQRRMTRNSTYECPEAWSPDGNTLLFTTDRDGNLEIYAISLHGHTAINLTNHPASEQWATWSPDGSRIAINCNVAHYSSPHTSL